MVATLAPQANAPVRNKVGRPRAFQDEDVYRVMVEVISEVGYSGLTFALIATQIRCTTSALIRRFGDKQALVQGFIAWLSTDQQEGESDSLADLAPIERIKARWLRARTNSPKAKPELFLAFFIEARSDPAYRPRLATLSEQFEGQVVSDLNDAVKAKQLRATDTRELGHTLVCALLGSVSLWLDHQRSTLDAAVSRTLTAVLEPYLAH
jgi:AcrR family transcriptional regulator